MKTLTATELINFEKEIIKEYKKGETYSPVHLSGGNEEQLIRIFKNVKSQDWVFTTHRSHYHALLKSNNKDWLMNEIINEENSSHINSSKYKIFSSAIVSGIIPIALGVAMGIKIKKTKDKVFCFIGDMSSEMGCFNEAQKYAILNNLPITFVIEDNGMGVNTPTNKAWGSKKYPNKKVFNIRKDRKTIYYNYKRFYPHYGIGEWIIFNKKKIKGVGDYQAQSLR